MTRYTYYICPNCKRPTSEMQPHPEPFDPPAALRMARPDVGPLAQEQLQCPCGGIVNWYTVIPVEQRIDLGPALWQLTNG